MVFVVFEGRQRYPMARHRIFNNCDFKTVANPVDIYMIMKLLVINLANTLTKPPSNSKSSDNPEETVKTCPISKPDASETWLDKMNLFRIAY